MSAVTNAPTPSQPEVWLRGSLPDVPPLLQPVAHALLQAREEVTALMTNFPEDLLWTRPGNEIGSVASVGFHLQHLTGVLDRLFTYARNEGLSAEQLQALAAEGKPDSTLSVDTLVAAFHAQVTFALSSLRDIDTETLTASRTVGRNLLPSTVVGLLVHAAEHIQRHVGQLLVTARVQSRNPAVRNGEAP